MRNFICLFLFSNFFINFSFTQENYEALFTKAENLFNSAKYEEAIPLYEKLVEKYPDTLYFKFRLGICCLYKNDKYEEALKNLKEVYEKKPDAKDINFYLGRAFHINYLFDEALKHFYMAKADSTLSDKMQKEIEWYIKYCNNGKEYFENPRHLDIQNIGAPINTDGVEYGPIISSDENTLIYTYRGEKSIGGLQKDGYHDDIMVSYRLEGDLWSKPASISRNINTDANESAIALSPDGQALFIYKFTSEDQGDIYLSILIGKRWTVPKKLNGDVNTSFWEGSCSLSSNGRVLYFSSKRIGGYGGKDIYKAYLMPDSTWGNVENLGPEINTERDEDGPFLYPSGTILFFVSNGHNSMGGYDIMQSNLDENGHWSAPYNLGYPINTVDNDIYYVISAQGKGYYSSAREGGYGKQDIYTVTPGIVGKKPAIAIVKGLVTVDGKGAGINIKVISETTGKEIGTYRSNSETGKYLITLAPGDKYKIIYQPKGIAAEERELDASNLNDYKVIDEVISFNSILDKRLQELYDDAIKRADKAFSAGDYINAILFFKEALGYKPDEQYPKDKIAEAKKLLMEAMKNGTYTASDYSSYGKNNNYTPDINDINKKIVIKNNAKNNKTIGNKDYYTVQIAASVYRSVADSIAQVFKKLGYDPFIQFVTFTDVNESWYRVRIGEFKTLKKASNFAKKLLKEPLPQGKVWIDLHREDDFKTEKMNYTILKVFRQK